MYVKKNTDQHWDKTAVRLTIRKRHYSQTDDCQNGKSQERKPTE